MKIKPSLLFVSALLSFVVFCSSNGQAQPRPRSNQPQWEYLVVSFGKVFFSNPMTDPEAKEIGYSKLLSFSQAGIVTAQEALSTQRSMDTLGKFGWELVGVVGAIGGDQEMLFKRPFDESRSKQEEELIKQEGENLRKILEAERAKTSRAAPATELVDLDEIDRIEARNANRKGQEDRLRTATASVSTAKPKSILSNSYSANDVDVTATFVVDGTTELLTDGNKYRSGAAKQLAESTLKSLMEAAGVREGRFRTGTTGYVLGDVKISVEVVINFGGKEKIVATARSGGSW